MLFNSIDFAIFFIVVTILFFALKHKYRWVLLLLASCYFYMAFVPIYIFILAFTIIVDYFAGILIERSNDQKRKRFLILSLITNIGVLAVFKYYNYLNDNLTLLIHGIGYKNPIPFLSIILPIGLSFHTFQAMSYTIEVYRGKQKAEKHFGIYALYVMFYPQLVSGPIERPQNLLHQFHEEHFFDSRKAIEGLKMMLWGLFKKVVIADRLAIYVNAVYNNSEHHTGLTLILACIFFSFQIYCDFSGYSDIAIGAAKVMGFDLMTNFKRPLFSKSVSDFWKRWHVSLSTWFRDYLYFPLGGNRVAVPRWYLNLLIVFVISGLWHGANTTFIIWGALNGMFYIIGIMTRKPRKWAEKVVSLNRLPRFSLFLDVATTFVLVTFARVFFRSTSVHQAFSIIKRMFRFDGPVFYDHDNPSSFIYCFLCIIFLLVYEAREEYGWTKYSVFESRHVLVRYFSYAVIVISVILFGVFDGGQFIYFQF